jgi:beta-lactamase superfamily II metal-dependent hydrolase
MSTKVHFIDVGQGNMTLLQLDNGKVFLYDCNITDENEDDALGYVAKQIRWGTAIDVFICSHRDSDHMRGVKKVHEHFPIQHVWDSGVAGTTPDCDEYKEYMDLRRQVGFTNVTSRKRWDYGNTRLRVMNSKNDDLADNPNAQSIVIKVEHRDTKLDATLDSVMLCGDTDAVTWQNIQQHYSKFDLSSSLLLGSHHGSITFFDDPNDDKHYYTVHMKAMAPAMTILSVGDNGHGHPDPKAIELYEQYSSGSNKGNKLYRTDLHGNMHVMFKDGGGWNLQKTL